MNDHYESVSKIINGISIKNYDKFKDLDYEDLRQELWVKILTTELSKGCKLDLDLVAKICYDYVVDLQRYYNLRNHYSLNTLEEYDSPLQFTEIEEIVSINQLRSLFRSNTKEAIFIEYWMEASGIKDFGYRPEGAYCDGYTESNLSKLLGFSGSSDKGYRKFRKHMRSIIKNFFVK